MIHNIPSNSCGRVGPLASFTRSLCRQKMQKKTFLICLVWPEQAEQGAERDICQYGGARPLATSHSHLSTTLSDYIKLQKVRVKMSHSMG